MFLQNFRALHARHYIPFDAKSLIEKSKVGVDEAIDFIFGIVNDFVFRVLFLQERPQIGDIAFKGRIRDLILGAKIVF